MHPPTKCSVWPEVRAPHKCVKCIFANVSSYTLTSAIIRTLRMRFVVCLMLTGTWQRVNHGSVPTPRDFQSIVDTNTMHRQPIGESRDGEAMVMTASVGMQTSAPASSQTRILSKPSAAPLRVQVASVNL